MWRKRSRKLNRDIAIAVAACVLVLTASIGASSIISQLVTERNFNEMQGTVEQLSADLANRITSEKAQMHLVAGMIAMHDYNNFAVWQDTINRLPRENSVTGYAVLFPDNTVLFDTNCRISLAKPLDFNEEAAKGAHISDFFDTAAGKFFAYVQPIVRNGEVIGLLYGFCDPAAFNDFFKSHIHDSRYQAHLIFAKSGNVVVDTYHNTTVNLNDEITWERDVIGGRSFAEMKDDMQSGRAGYTVFRERIAKESYYSFYQPVGKYNLVLQITVPEDVVFNEELSVRHIVYYLGIIQAIIIFCYISFLIYERYNELKGYQQRIERTRFIYDISQLLLGVNADPYSITAALHLITERVGARLIFFARFEKSTVRRIYCWPVKEKIMLDSIDKNNHIDSIYKALNCGVSIYLDEKTVAELKASKSIENLPGIEVKNIFMVPIIKKYTGLIGMFAAFNITDVQDAQTIMEECAESFMMAVQNSESYDMVRRLGTIDQLTGLKNRNAYQQAMISYENSNEKLCCIYIDANGLHELNNTLGHAAGDKLLQGIASVLKENFGMQDVYRIGGDEFAVFCQNKADNEIASLIAKVKETLEHRNYHIAAGWAFAEDDKFLQRTIEAAEKAMYLDKSRYYATADTTDKKRVMNRELEDIMSEKRDRDEFLRVISSNYLGVYAINLATDDTRIIYRPNYFAEMLEANDYRFSKAIRSYAKIMVAPDSQDTFAMLFDYQMINEKLKNNINIEVVYRKTDDTLVRVRVYPTEEYSADNRTTLWIFEIVRL